MAFLFLLAGIFVAHVSVFVMPSTLRSLLDRR